MQYWILQHNPAILSFNIPNPPGVPDDRDYWHISRYEDKVAIGDVAFIWHAGTYRGIYDVATVVSIPPHAPKAVEEIELLMRNDEKDWLNKPARNRLRQLPTILIERQYHGGLQPPVLVEELRKHGFSDLQIIRMAQRGIYHVEQDMGARLLEYIRRTRR